MVATATVAVGLTVPLVLAGELRGNLFEASCLSPGALVRIQELPNLAKGPIRPIVVSSGDILGPEPLSGFAFEGPTQVQADLQKIFLGDDQGPVFDAAALGDLELASPSGSVDRLGYAQVVPWTAANVPVQYGRSHRVLGRGGVKVGITSVVDETLAPGFTANLRGAVRPAADALNSAIGALRQAGVDAVVAMIHVPPSAGLGAVVRILGDLSGNVPDLILTSPLRGDPSFIRLDGFRTVVVPAPIQPSTAAVVHLGFATKDGRLLSIVGNRVSVPSYPSGSAEIVRNWVCQNLAVPILDSPSSGSTPSGMAERSEVVVNRDLFVRFVLERMRRIAGAEIAFLPRSALGPEAAFPLAASLTRLAVRRALPRNDRLFVAELRGSRVTSLEALVQDPQVASMGLEGGKIAGRARDIRRIYRVVTTEFVAKGGDKLLDPDKFSFRPLDGNGSLRDRLIDDLKVRGFLSVKDTVVSGREPLQFDARLDIGASIKTVSVENRSNAEASQLSRQNFLGVSGDAAIRLLFDFPEHRLELLTQTRFGVVREAADAGAQPETRENEDLTILELLYSGRLAGGLDRPWLPNAGASTRFETELTIPDERNYRRALLQLGAGPSWQLARNLLFRSQLGLRRELFASGDSSDPVEAALAETRVALLSTVELRDEPLLSVSGKGAPALLNVRIDHTADLSGTVRDQVTQGRIGVDVPVVPGIAVTAAIDVYILERKRRNGPSASAGALDTSFGIKSTMDISDALY